MTFSSFLKIFLLLKLKLSHYLIFCKKIYKTNFLCLVDYNLAPIFFFKTVSTTNFVHNSYDSTLFFLFIHLHTMPKPTGSSGEKNLVCIRLIELRRQQGLSQRDLAHKLLLAACPSTCQPPPASGYLSHHNSGAYEQIPASALKTLLSETLFCCLLHVIPCPM